MQFFLVTALLALAMHLGLNSYYHSFWGLPILGSVFAAQAAAVRLLAKENFARVFRRVLFAQLPLALLILNNTFWPVLQPQIFYAVVLSLVIAAAIFASGRDIGPEDLRRFFYLYLPLTITLSLTSHWKLVQFINEWRLFAEEGQMLGWITKVLHGGVPYRDMIVTRGPAAIYALAAVVRLLGETLVNERAGVLGLGICMAYLYYVFCAAFIKTVSLRWLTFVSMYLVHEFSYRTGFSVGALALFWLGIRSDKKGLSLLSGICAAMGVLSSLDAGISSIAAILATAIAGGLFAEEQRGSFRTHGTAMIAGLLILFLPISLTLLFRGELGTVIQGAIVYPKYALLGFAASPYPNILQSMRADMDTGRLLFPQTTRVFAMWYLPVLLYLFTFFLVLRSALSRRLPTGRLMLLTLSVYGWVLYRSVLGRSDFHHLYFSIPPALALAFLHADQMKTSLSWGSLFDQKERFVAACLFCFLPVCFLWQRPQDRLYPLVQSLEGNILGSPYPKPEHEPFGQGRLAGLYAPKSVRKKIELIQQMITSQRKSGDRIYAFPNLPLYYFLFDSPNPTRYEWAYQAITHAMRLEAVDSLSKAKPQFVINSLDPHQRLDRIPPRQAVPEILQFLQQNYKRWTSIGRDEILVPKESPLQENQQPQIEEGPEEENPADPGEE